MGDWPPGTLLASVRELAKEKSTQAFIMSLPVSSKQFGLAKLLINLSVFAALWLAITGIAYYFGFGRRLFPAGLNPYFVMIFLGAIVACTGILSVSLWRQSLGLTVLAIALLEMGTSAYLSVVAYLDPIAKFMHGLEMVWNRAAIRVVAIQVLTTVAMLSAALFQQSRKRDFV